MTVRDTQMVRDQKTFENHWSRGIKQFNLVNNYNVTKLYFTANKSTMYTSCYDRVFTCLYNSSLRLNRHFFSNPLEVTN